MGGSNLDERVDTSKASPSASNSLEHAWTEKREGPGEFRLWYELL